MFDGKFANLKDLSLANEWVSTSIAKYMSGEDEDLHAMLRRDFASLIPAKAGDIGAIRLDTFQVDALMEVRFPVKCVFQCSTLCFQVKVILSECGEVIRSPLILLHR